MPPHHEPYRLDNTGALTHVNGRILHGILGMTEFCFSEIYTNKRGSESIVLLPRRFVCYFNKPLLHSR